MFRCLVAVLVSLAPSVVVAQETVESAAYTSVPIALPSGETGNQCRAQRRIITVTCNLEDWCTVVDVVHLPPGKSCTDQWKINADRTLDVYRKPQMAGRLLGKPPVSIGATACSDEVPLGWCFHGVPPAERLRFEMQVRASGTSTEKIPGMVLRHRRLSDQSRRGSSRKGITLSLAPRAWRQAPPTQVTATGNLAFRYEVVGKNQRNAQRLTTLDVSDSSTALIVAKRSGDYGDDVRVRVPGRTPFIDVAYERRGTFGFAGVSADVGAELSSDGAAVAGGVMAEGWVGPLVGVGAGAEGSSSGRVGVRTDVRVLSRAPRPDKLVSMPAFGASAGLVVNVVPEVSPGLRLRGLAQFQYLGIHAGLDAAPRSAPRVVAGVSFSL